MLIRDEQRLCHRRITMKNSLDGTRRPDAFAPHRCRIFPIDLCPSLELCHSSGRDCRQRSNTSRRNDKQAHCNVARIATRESNNRTCETESSRNPCKSCEAN
jgi:hypothetical protein